MGATLVTGPTQEPLTLAEAKAHLRVDSADLDAEIAAGIIAATQYVEAYTRRCLMTQTWDVTYDWDWPETSAGQVIQLPIEPVASITSITYLDSAGATQTLAASQYVVLSGPDMLTRIVPAYNVTWPTVLDRQSTITVRAVCGYTSQGAVPAPLRQAMLMHIELMLDRDVQSQKLLEQARDSLMAFYRVQRW